MRQTSPEFFCMRQPYIFFILEIQEQIVQFVAFEGQKMVEIKEKVYSVWLQAKHGSEWEIMFHLHEQQ